MFSSYSSIRFKHFKHVFVVCIIDVSSENEDTVARCGDIGVNRLARNLSESMLSRFVAPRNRQRKRRTIFTAAATHLLQTEFATDCYPDNARLQQLAQLVGHADVAAIQVRLEQLYTLSRTYFTKS